MTRWLILAALLCATALLGYLAYLRSSTSTPPTPPTSTNLEPVVESMMTTLRETVQAMTSSQDSSVSKMTELVETLTLGRQQTTETTGQPLETSTTPTMAEMWAEVDGTPLPSGLTDLMEREAEEDYRAHLKRERIAFQARLAQLRTEATEAGFSPEDWQGLSQEQ